MAVISITVPDEVLPRVIDGMAAAHGWSPPDGPKAAFAKRMLIRYVIANVRSAEREAEAALVPISTVTDVDGLV